MPPRLLRVSFLPEDVRALAGFSCGDAPWERELNDWLGGTSADNVLAHLHAGGEAWLYVTDEEGVVGFGSLAWSNWRWPARNDRPRRVAIIPALGVRDDMKGKPDGVPIEDRYSVQILLDLVDEAARRLTALRAEGIDIVPVLGLFVHPDNSRAIRFYQRAGFQPFFRTYTDPDSGVAYRSMLLRLPLPE